MGIHEVDGEPSSREVAADLDETIDTDRAGGRQRRCHVDRLPISTDVEVGVVVYDGDRQPIGELRLPSTTGSGRHSRSCQPSSWPSSWAMTASSSLTKTGTGLPIAVPTATGRDTQRGVSEYSPVMTG